MLLCKFVVAKKEDTTSIEAYLKEMKEIIDQLELLQNSILEDLIVFLVLHVLSKEYQYFTRMQIGKDSLSSFDELESKLLDEEIQVKVDAEHESASEALLVKRNQHCNPRTQQQPKSRDLQERDCN